MREFISVLFLIGCVGHVTSIEEGEFAAIDLSEHGKIPPYKASIQNPVPSDEISIQRGQRLYLFLLCELSRNAWARGRSACCGP